AEYGALQATYFTAVVSPRVRRARALLTVSEFSRDALAQNLDIPPARFRVVYPGVDAAFRPTPPEALERFRRERDLPERYFLALGNEKPFKNLALLARVAPRLPMPLVLVAGKGAGRRLGFPPSTVDLGEVSDQDLPFLYGAAVALLLPSRY